MNERSEIIVVLKSDLLFTVELQSGKTLTVETRTYKPRKCHMNSSLVSGSAFEREEDRHSMN